MAPSRRHHSDVGLPSGTVVAVALARPTNSVVVEVLDSGELGRHSIFARAQGGIYKAVCRDRDLSFESLVMSENGVGYALVKRVSTSEKGSTGYHFEGVVALRLSLVEAGSVRADIEHLPLDPGQTFSRLLRVNDAGDRIRAIALSFEVGEVATRAQYNIVEYSPETGGCLPLQALYAPRF